MLAVFADPLTAGTVELLRESGFDWKELSSVRALEQLDEPFDAIVVCTSSDPEGALLLCKSLRASQTPSVPTLLLSTPRWLEQFVVNADVFDELVALPSSGEELRARVSLARQRIVGHGNEDVIDYEEISINVTNYQASVAGRPLDMTYMEYKLLKYFVSNCDRVLTREQLLRDVWGYEYFGGARTVDVHVRRLRAKLGEEKAHLIQTVRSVGYLFSRERVDS